MAKKRPDNPPPAAQARQAKQLPPKQAPKPQRSSSGLPWHVTWRCLVSLLVVLHMAAVISAPWNLSTGNALPPGYVAPSGQPEVPPNNSPVWQQPALTRPLHHFFRHYLNLIYMNHGYEFFAPDPSGTHLISYRVAQPDGSNVTGTFPNLADQWPRLFYHRHMMLAEQTQMMGRESGQNYADHLATVHGGPSRIDWMVHTLLSPYQVLEGTPLDDRSTYQVLESLDGQPRRPTTTAEPLTSSEAGR